jgi:hypothetical protein
MWFFVTESLLAFTIFRDEIDIPECRIACMGSHGNALRRYTRIARIRCHALDAARHATFGGETFKGALQELGFSKFRFRFRWRLPFLFHHHEHDDEPAEMGTAVTESLDRARRRTYEQLEK